MAFAFGRATSSLRQAPLMCLDNPVLGNIIFSLNGEHHLLLKVLHFRVDKRQKRNSLPVNSAKIQIQPQKIYFLHRFVRNAG